MLFGSLFARQLLKLKDYLLDEGKSLMDLIGNLISSMVITLSLKSKIIPNSAMVFVPIMRPKAGLPMFFYHTQLCQESKRPPYCCCIQNN